MSAVAIRSDTPFGSDHKLASRDTPFQGASPVVAPHGQDTRAQGTQSCRRAVCRNQTRRFVTWTSESETHIIVPPPPGGAQIPLTDRPSSRVGATVMPSATIPGNVTSGCMIAPWMRRHHGRGCARSGTSTKRRVFWTYIPISYRLQLLVSLRPHIVPYRHYPDAREPDAGRRFLDTHLKFVSIPPHRRHTHVRDLR